jgi:arylsulfatase A-like enzyme
LTDRLTDEAIDFISSNQSRPWFLYLTHFAVHTPLQAKSGLLEKYQHKPAGQLHDSAVMAAMIESVDEGVGRIMKTLRQLDLAGKTAVVFTSDNGGYGPATSMRPLKGYKGTYYEGGIRVPLFVHWPGVVAAGATCDVPVINVDLYPTFCQLTGATMPPDQPRDGVSLMPLLRGERLAAERALFWHFPAYLQSYQRFDQQRDPLFRSRPCSIMRDGDWKLHEYFEDGGLELYNLQEDPGEQTNLADRYPGKLTQMHRQLQQWRQATQAPVPREPNPHHDPAAEAAAIKKKLAKR